MTPDYGKGPLYQSSTAPIKNVKLSGVGAEFEKDQWNDVEMRGLNDTAVILKIPVWKLMKRYCCVYLYIFFFVGMYTVLRSVPMVKPNLNNT